MSGQMVYSKVEEKIWETDDNYLVIPEIQVDSRAFRKGDRVKITIEHIITSKQV